MEANHAAFVDIRYIFFCPYLLTQKKIHNDEGVEAVGEKFHGSIEFAGHGYLKRGSQVKRVVFIIIIVIVIVVIIITITRFYSFSETYL